MSVLIAATPVSIEDWVGSGGANYESSTNRDTLIGESHLEASVTDIDKSANLLSNNIVASDAIANETSNDNPFGSKAVSDEVLAEQRGGIRLPSGIDVVLSVETRTAIDGQVVLQTVVKIDSGAPVTTVYVPETGSTVTVPQRSAASGFGATATVTYDRQSGIRISRFAPAPGIPVAARLEGHMQQLEGLKEIDISTPVNTDRGLVSSIGDLSRPGVELNASDIQLTHFTGRAFGSGIFNSGSDRIIDTQTTISIDLHNAGPDVLGSAMFRVENVAIAAMSIRL